MANEIKFNSGFNVCGDKVAILRNEVVPKDLSNVELLNSSDLGADSYIFVDAGGKEGKVALADIQGGAVKIQPDMSESDPESPRFVRNRLDSNLFLSESLRTAYSIGGIKKNTVYEAGTPVSQILKDLLTASAIDSGLKFGLVSEIPSSVDDLQDVEVNREDLLTKGITFKGAFNNQYYALAVPVSLGLTVDAVIQSGFELSFEKRPKFDAQSLYDLYFCELPVTGTYTFRFEFKEQTWSRLND